MEKSKLDEIRDELANHEANEAWKWAYEKLETKDASIGYEHGVRAGMKLGWDAAMERVKPLVEELDVISRFVYSSDTSISTPEALIAKEALAKFRGDL